MNSDPLTCACHAHNGFLTRAGYRAVEEAAKRGLTQGDMFDTLTGIGSVSAFEQSRRRLVEYDHMTDSERREVLDGS